MNGGDEEFQGQHHRQVFRDDEARFALKRFSDISIAVNLSETTMMPKSRSKPTRARR